MRVSRKVEKIPRKMQAPGFIPGGNKPPISLINTELEIAKRSRLPGLVDVRKRQYDNTLRKFHAIRDYGVTLRP